MTITITHTHEEGTLLSGSSKGDGVYEIVRRHGFTWFRSIGAIGIRGSRDQLARRWVIDGAAKALREAGHEVTVDIDDTPRDRGTVLADQADRLDDRHEALAGKAAKRAGEADAQWSLSDRLVEHIPPGQPILVGHYSERGHRRTLERAQNAAFKAVALGREAKDVARRADAVGSSAAYSATPAVTARRIETTQAELRKVQRSLDGYTTRSLDGKGRPVYVDEHPPASGEHREALEARKAWLEERLRYDQAALAAAAAEGRHVVWSADSVHVGDLVNGRKVVRVNRATVSVETGYSWTDKVRFTEIRKVVCTHDEPGSGAVLEPSTRQDSLPDTPVPSAR